MGWVSGNGTRASSLTWLKFSSRGLGEVSLRLYPLLLGYCPILSVVVALLLPFIVLDKFEVLRGPPCHLVKLSLLLREPSLSFVLLSHKYSRILLRFFSHRLWRALRLFEVTHVAISHCFNTVLRLCFEEHVGVAVLNLRGVASLKLFLVRLADGI